MIWNILLMFSLSFLVGTICAGEWEMVPIGLWKIWMSPAQFTVDYFALAGVGAAFLNASLVGLFCCALLYWSKATCNGLTIAAYWLNVGFATFGMNPMNMWPFILGVWVYGRIRKVPFRELVPVSLYATALAPFASELMFRYPYTATRELTVLGLVMAIALGIFVGCVMPALCAHVSGFHKGYDLYNAGPAAGILSFFIYCLLYLSPGIPVPDNTLLGEGNRAFVTVFFLLLFTGCLLIGYRLDKNCFRQYKALLKNDSFKIDYTETFGVPVTLVNMGVYGLFILLYYQLVQGIVVVDGLLLLQGATFTGATMGAIMCMFAFCAQGAQPKNVFPVMIGYALASFVPLLSYLGGISEVLNWSLTSQSMLLGLCFASGLAPVAGKWGMPAGVVVGFMHAIMVTSVPLWHGGFCLYNGGFTCGLVAFLLIPVLERFAKPCETEVAESRHNLYNKEKNG
ncbi:MAG: DUF1576 domain-containing protein [Lachnospiraceae bacterium]|nr:DUF1576 domain-containing protein [Lachnospiraceae bacterium]